MTLDDARLFTDHFTRHPPLRVLVKGVAAALGIKFELPDDKPKKYLTAEELRLIVEATGGRVPGMSGGPHG